MSSEQNVPEVYEYQGEQAPPIQGEQGGEQLFGQNSQPGMGQSKSSRRRRRKRKNKPDGPGGEQAVASDSPGNSQVIPSMQAGAAPQAPQQQGGFQNQGGQQNANGTKRWKKKFRDRDRPRFSDNPGNNGGGAPSNGGSNGGGGFSAQGHQSHGGHRDRDSHQPGNTVSGFKRKGGGGGGGKQRDRGPRSFVGPMDHSYRAVNGNFNDAPPSTIAIHGHRGNGRTYTGDSQPIDYSQGKAIPIPEDAPTKILFFIEDLFLTAKINETSRKLGVKVAFVKNDKEALAELTSREEADRPGLIVVDLNNANAKPMTLIPKLKTKLKKSTSIIGFLSHIQGDLKAKAVEVGCDTVMARAAFSQNLPNLLRRYGIADEEESNFNH